jgi:hypothetical protein
MTCDDLMNYALRELCGAHQKLSRGDFYCVYGRTVALPFSVIAERVNSCADTWAEACAASLFGAGEDGFEFFGGDYFQLGEGAGFWFAVGAPAAEVGHVAEAAALHVFVGDFDDKFGAERFPLEVLAAAPTALAAGHAVFG